MPFVQREVLLHSWKLAGQSRARRGSNHIPLDRDRLLEVAVLGEGHRDGLAERRSVLALAKVLRHRPRAVRIAPPCVMSRGVHEQLSHRGLVYTCTTLGFLA